VNIVHVLTRNDIGTQAKFLEDDIIGTLLGRPQFEVFIIDLMRLQSWANICRKTSIEPPESIDYLTLLTLRVFLKNCKQIMLASHHNSTASAI